MPNLQTAPDVHNNLALQFQHIRKQSELLAKRLSAEDCQLQSMPDASPTKWHLAHLTWFFETFILEAYENNFSPFDGSFRVLFNSYYTGSVTSTREPSGVCQDGFAFDNETQRHRAYIAPFELASRLVTNGDYIAFMADGGCQRPELWLSLGWDWVRAGQHALPLYWQTSTTAHSGFESVTSNRHPAEPSQATL